MYNWSNPDSVLADPFGGCLRSIPWPLSCLPASSQPDIEDCSRTGLPAPMRCMPLPLQSEATCASVPAAIPWPAPVTQASAVPTRMKDPSPWREGEKVCCSGSWSDRAGEGCLSGAGADARHVRASAAFPIPCPVRSFFRFLPARSPFVFPFRRFRWRLRVARRIRRKDCSFPLF